MLRYIATSVEYLVKTSLLADAEPFGWFARDCLITASSANPSDRFPRQKKRWDIVEEYFRSVQVFSDRKRQKNQQTVYGNPEDREAVQTFHRFAVKDGSEVQSNECIEYLKIERIAPTRESDPRAGLKVLLIRVFGYLRLNSGFYLLFCFSPRCRCRRFSRNDNRFTFSGYTSVIFISPVLNPECRIFLHSSLQ
jgi:hypothetical protein